MPALVDLGIVDGDGMPLYAVSDSAGEGGACCAVAYLRGAFLGGGFVADPHGDFHFELTAETEAIAHDFVKLMERFDIHPHVTLRRVSLPCISKALNLL